MNRNKQTDMAAAPLGGLMAHYALPCTISLLVAALYNIVDQVFIANADYLGSYGNAANTVVYPLTVVALAVAVMIGDGCCAFVSLSMGRREPEHAAKSVGSAVTLSAAAGVALCILYLLLATPLLTLFGGTVNERTWQYSREYFFYITLGIPVYVFGQAMNPVIRSDGSPRAAMAVSLAGAVANLILDPVFLYAFRWGMMGAAVATVIGQVLTAALSVVYLFRMKQVRLRRRDFRPSAGILKQMLPLGICSFLSQFSLVLSMAAINSMVRKYGALDPVYGREEFAQIPMAVVGIVMKFFQIVISISVGLSAGCIPIVGYNMGARRPDRVRGLLTRLILTEALVGAAATVIVVFFPNALINLFGAANESGYYREFAVKAFRTYLCLMVFACVNKASFIFLQAMGKAASSTALSMVREVVFGVGFALLLPLRFGLDGVLYSMPVSDALTAVISAALLVRTYRQLSRQTRQLSA